MDISMSLTLKSSIGSSYYEAVYFSTIIHLYSEELFGLICATSANVLRHSVRIYKRSMVYYS